MLYRGLGATGWRGSGRSLWCHLFHRTDRTLVVMLHGHWRDVLGCSRCDQYDVPRWGSRR